MELLLKCLKSLPVVGDLEIVYLQIFNFGQEGAGTAASEDVFFFQHAEITSTSDEQKREWCFKLVPYSNVS